MKRIFKEDLSWIEYLNLVYNISSMKPSPTYIDTIESISKYLLSGN